MVASSPAQLVAKELNDDHFTQERKEQMMLEDERFVVQMWASVVVLCLLKCLL
jgi:hypothetical protein